MPKSKKHLLFLHVLLFFQNLTQARKDSLFYSFKNKAQTARIMATSIHCVPASHVLALSKEAAADSTAAMIERAKNNFDNITFFI
jgi:hypothetical protein